MGHYPGLKAVENEPGSPRDRCTSEKACCCMGLAPKLSAQSRPATMELVSMGGLQVMIPQKSGLDLLP